MRAAFAIWEGARTGVCLCHRSGCLKMRSCPENDAAASIVRWRDRRERPDPRSATRTRKNSVKCSTNQKTPRFRAASGR